MKFENRKEKLFIAVTCAVSFIQALAYVYDGVLKGFTANTYYMLALDLMYLPLIIFFRRKGFIIYTLSAALSLIFYLAFCDSYLYNNFTPLLCLIITILIIPKYKNVIMALYLVFTLIAFAINSEPVYYYIAHACRAIFFYCVFDIIIYARFMRKPVIFTPEEELLLKQLTDGSQIKSLELNGLSERTIRRRLEAAMKRNGVSSTNELKDLYINIVTKK